MALCVVTVGRKERYHRDSAIVKSVKCHLAVVVSVERRNQGCKSKSGSAFIDFWEGRGR